jgi:hypothetical protein
MAKRRIEFLKTCTGWVEGYITTIELEDNAFYYFNDEWDRWTLIEKHKEGEDFLVYEPKKRKPRTTPISQPSEQPEPVFHCGGKDTTYNNLMKRVEQLKHG